MNDDKKLQYALDFIHDIANEHPIEPTDYEINICRFCRSSWAESKYDEYLKNVEILRKDPQALTSSRIHRLANEHHEEDCLWVRANYWIRELRPEGS